MTGAQRGDSDAAAPEPSFRDQLAEAIVGWVIAADDYYSQSINTDEAKDIADALLPLVEARVQAAANQPVRCPKCNGQGAVSKPPWVPGDVHQWNSSGVAPYVCNLCDGRMVIDRALAQPAPRSEP